MGTSEDRLARIGRLVAYLLDRSGPASRAQLEELFPEYEGPSGRRRFEDDKAALRRGGVPLRVVERDGAVVGYEIRREDHELPALPLTADQQVALHLAMRSVDFASVPWGRFAGTKLGVDGLSPVATVTHLPGIDALPALHDAVSRRCPVTFVYQGGERREIDPWGLVFKHGRWYVPGADHRRSAPRVFRVDRIDVGTLELGEPGTVTVPDDVSLGDLVPDDPLRMAGGETVVARVRLDRGLAGVLPGGTLVEVAPGGGEVVVELEVTHVDAFVSWALGLGDLVVVESPPALRGAVVARLRELAG